MDDVEMRERLKLTGEIGIRLPDAVEVIFSALEVVHEAGAWRARWDAPLSELRKLARVGPAFAAMLSNVDGEPETARGNLRVVASPALARQLDASLPADTIPQDWLGVEAFGTLLFTLGPWTPEAVGIVTSSTE